MINLVSISGGKDSTATALLAIERGVENLRFVFCDTGNEHQITYDYIEYLNAKLMSLCGIGITILKADFSAKIAAKREKLLQEGEGERAEHLIATGNPFLDLAILKGRFPSTMARFCTTELKVNMIKKFIAEALAVGEDVDSWVGIRAEESLKRSMMSERELFFSDKDTSAEAWQYRPILKWTAQDCFTQLKRFNIEPNPLYKMGMGRVGCMPCINCRKGELNQIARDFPEVIDRIRQWEKQVGLASPLHKGTFFPMVNGCEGIDAQVAWASTSRGGKQYQLDFEETTTCKSLYGLCE